MRHHTARFTALLALLFSAAIFGFFYAWICSTMWGLDALDPRIAIAAMQGMNDSVRNAVFAPAFFGTPLVCALASVAACRIGCGPATMAFATATVVYAAGGMALTMAINVPMNRALGAMKVPEDISEAQAIWQAYSPRWQVFNTLRTIASGIAVVLCGWGLMALPQPAPANKRNTLAA